MADKSRESEASLIKYPIRTVTELTGVHSVTLRAWERRYGLIMPERTPKGHRLYTQADIETIQRITELLNQGIAISQVRPLLESGLSRPAEEQQSVEADIWQRYRNNMLSAIERFEENEVEHLYNDALSLYPLGLVQNHLLIPLLHQLGERWKNREAGICEEHFFTTYLRSKLGSRIQHLNQHNSGPLLLIACLPDEYHEVGMMMFTLAVLDKGYRALILGANAPIEQIPVVHRRRACAGIVLSASSPISNQLLEKELPTLVEQVAIPVFIGGRASERHREAILNAGAQFASNDIQYALSRIHERIPLNTPPL